MFALVGGGAEVPLEYRAQLRGGGGVGPQSACVRAIPERGALTSSSLASRSAFANAVDISWVTVALTISVPPSIPDEAAEFSKSSDSRKSCSLPIVASTPRR